MKISKQARRDAKQLLATSHVNGLLDEARVRQVVQQVIARKPRGYGALLSHFQRLVKLELDQRTARIENAVPVTPGEADRVKAAVSRRYGPGLDFVFTTNAALLGGARIQIGSDVYDGSVRARLQALAESF